MPPPDTKHLSRIDNARTHGWQVRVRREGRTHSRLFSDGVFGDAERAQAAAIVWRDALLKRLPPPTPRAEHLTTPAVRAKAAASASRTGVTGIGFTVRTRTDGQRVPYVTAHWRDAETERRRSTGYSILHHGAKGALRLAVRTMREGRGDAPTRGQIDYLVRKALPEIERLVRRTS